MPTEPWHPTTFLRYVTTIKSSSLTAVVQTDAGAAYLKAINNPQGVHVLACDWLGTHLARRFGLQTFDVAILELTELDEIPLTRSSNAQVGPSFVAREEKGNTMGGSKALARVSNADDLARLIVFDTWVRNCDRHGPGYGREGQARENLDNLFLSAEGERRGKFTLKAIDHGHIFTCGKPLTPRLANIENIQDERIYGFFPFFEGHVTIEQIVTIGAAFRDIGPAMWQDLLARFPSQWEVSFETKQAIDAFLARRAQFLIDNLRQMWRSREVQPSLDFDSTDREEL